MAVQEQKIVLNNEEKDFIDSLKPGTHIFSAEFNLYNNEDGSHADNWIIHEYEVKRKLQKTTIECFDVKMPKVNIKLDVNSGFGFDAQTAVAKVIKSFEEVFSRMCACELDSKTV